MKLLFNYKEHKILVTRGLSFAQMDVDGSVVDVKSGLIATHMGNFDLKAKAENPDGTEDEILLRCSIGLFQDSFALYCNGELIETKRGSL